MKIYEVQPKLIGKKVQLDNLMKAVSFIHDKFMIEYKGSSKFDKNVQDHFYAMNLKEITLRDGSQSPYVTITPSDFRNWTGKDIPDIKSDSDFSAIVVQAQLKLEYAKTLKSFETEMNR